MKITLIGHITIMAKAEAITMIATLATLNNLEAVGIIQMLSKCTVQAGKAKLSIGYTTISALMELSGQSCACHTIGYENQN